MNAVIFEAVTKVFRERPRFFSFPGNSRANVKTALREVTLSIPAGKVLVLLGPNGSGKTTLLKLVSTMLLPDSGRVLVHGADTLQDSNRVRRSIGMAVVNERSFFPRLSARENLDFFATLEDVPREVRTRRVEHVLEVTGLADVSATQVMKFSSGMYQRLGTARALLKNPSVLLLDEPTRSLDPSSTPRFWDLVRTLAEQGSAVFLATHNFDEAFAVGDVVALLQQGSVADLWDVSQANGVEALRSRYFRSTGEYDLLSDLRARCTS